MTSELEELQNIAISIMQNPAINVIIDNSLETACTDFKSIYVTIQLIPPELQKFRRVVSRILDGQVAHEAGHIIKTTPIKDRLKVWKQCQENPALAEIVHQTLEDKRVNHFIINRYRFDFGRRLQLLADVTNRLWIDSLHAKLAEKRKDVANTMKPDSFLLEDMLIGISAMAGLWHIDLDKEFQLSEEQKQFVERTVAIFDEARFDAMIMSIVNRHQELYKLWSTRIRRTGEQPEKNCPKGEGGEMPLKPGMGTKQALKQMEKKFKKMEDDEKREAEKERRKQDKELPKDGFGAGAGTGLSIPTPEPNEPAYQQIAQRNREHIERLLTLLKRLATPRLNVMKWQKQGRFMTEILGTAYSSSLKRNVQDVYYRRAVQLEKTEACMSLLVDLSGSVPIEEAKDSLTVISEVCGRWLRDEDFAIMVFGGDYQKIKAFVEPYHTTRTRIGGMHSLGGTVMLNPLEELFKMVNAQRNHRAKVITIVSDFDVSKPNEVGKLLQTIAKTDIKVVGLGIGHVDMAFVRSYVKNYRYIGQIQDLPEAFFDLYKEVAL